MLGIESTFVDGSSLEDIRGALRERTKLIYLESPTSLCFQNPLAAGIDLVVHSTSKYIGGHSDWIDGK